MPIDDQLTRLAQEVSESLDVAGHLDSAGAFLLQVADTREKSEGATQARLGLFELECLRDAIAAEDARAAALYAIRVGRRIERVIALLR